MFANIVDIADGKTLPGVNYEEFLAQGWEDFLPSPVEDEMELITINYASGTAGQPRGVMYHHRGAYLIYSWASPGSSDEQQNKIVRGILPLKPPKRRLS